jgi:HK97 family phage portal protein
VSLFSRAQRTDSTAAAIPSRSALGKGGTVSPDQAMRNSAVWACLRLRNDLISTMPVDAYRKVGDVQVEVTKPPVLVAPGGKEWPMHHWLYAGGVALDRAGNNAGIITARDGLGFPAVIELQDLASVSVIVRDGKIHQWRIGGKLYDPADVWHEKQFPLPGFALGLSPIAHAAWTLELDRSAQEFQRDWFQGTTVPSGTLKNSEKTVNPNESTEIKQRFKASVGNGDLFVHGKDWEYKPIQGVASDANYLATHNATVPDIARFLGCPADVIEAAVSGQSITYANIGQRNLQLLIHHLGPAVMRREHALGTLMPDPRFVKLNSDALLRMDPETRSKMLGQKVKDRLIAPSEARALENRQPFTDEQLDEFDRLFGAPRTNPTLATSGATS